MSRPIPSRRTPRPSSIIYCMASTSGRCGSSRSMRARDVSEATAAKVRDVAEHDGRVLTSGTLAFIEAHVGRAIQPTLPLW
jgi:hypothetical protein